MLLPAHVDHAPASPPTRSIANYRGHINKGAKDIAVGAGADIRDAGVATLAF